MEAVTNNRRKKQPQGAFIRFWKTFQTTVGTFATLFSMIGVIGLAVYNFGGYTYAQGSDIETLKKGQIELKDTLERNTENAKQERQKIRDDMPSKEQMKNMSDELKRTNDKLDKTQDLMIRILENK